MRNDETRTDEEEKGEKDEEKDEGNVEGNEEEGEEKDEEEGENTEEIFSPFHAPTPDLNIKETTSEIIKEKNPTTYDFTLELPDSTDEENTRISSICGGNVSLDDEHLKKNTNKSNTTININPSSNSQTSNHVSNNNN